MFVLSKKKNEIHDINISGRIFVRDCSVCVGRAENKPCYLGDYDSPELAAMALRMLFEALKNPRICAYEMPLDKEVRARIANLPRDQERYIIDGKKTKGHGGS